MKSNESECISDHAGLTSLLKAKKTMNSVRLAGWAAKLQNVTTADGDFTIEYANGSSAIIACGADALSRLLDVGMEPEGDEWHTAASFRDYPVLQAIYAQLDKQMDGRGRPLGGLHTDTTASTEDSAAQDAFHLDELYEPDHLYTEEGRQFFDFDTVHPALHKSSNRLAAIDSAIGAGLATPPLLDSPVLPCTPNPKTLQTLPRCRPAAPCPCCCSHRCQPQWPHCPDLTIRKRGQSSLQCWASWARWWTRVRCCASEH
jgi:hypothetical protein